MHPAAFVTPANSGLLSASRSPMAMARDGLLPERLSQTHKRFGTPLLSLAVTTLFVLGPEAALALLAERYPDVEAVLVSEEKKNNLFL